MSQSDQPSTDACETGSPPEAKISPALHLEPAQSRAEVGEVQGAGTVTQLTLSRW